MGSRPVRSNPAVKLTADLIRSVYIQERRRREQSVTGLESRYNSHVMWDGGTHRGKEYQSVWEKAAKFVLANKYDPVLLVEAQFRGSAKNCPEPSQICSPLAIDRMLVYSEAHRNEMPSYLAHQKNVCHTALRSFFGSTDLSQEKIVAAVLVDRTLDMSALFRYCFAVHANVPHIADRFRDQAVMQYVRYPDDYDAIWKEMIPEGFREHAATTYPTLALQSEDDHG